MTGSATIEGAGQLLATLAVAGTALESLPEGNYQAGDAIAQALIVEAPRATGFLATTIAPVVDTNGVTVTAGAPYAAAVNAIDPFRERALDAVTGQITDIYTAAVSDVVGQIQGA